MTAFFYMYFAAFLALAYGTVNALIGIALTVIAYTLVNTVILRIAAQRAHRRAVQSRSMFGFVGAAIATLIFAATCDLLPGLRGLGRRGRRPDVLRWPDRSSGTRS